MTARSKSNLVASEEAKRKRHQSMEEERIAAMQFVRWSLDQPAVKARFEPAAMKRAEAEKNRRLNAWLESQGTRLELGSV